MIKLALFASGSGSNVENIARYLANHPVIQITRVYCNNPQAYVLERCKNLGLESRVFTREEFKQGQITQELLNEGSNLIVLAGFLWLIPAGLVAAFPDRIINVHPALLPNYGGKGMYGHHVHEAVVQAKESESGITIHLVNEEYDKGRILFQAKTALDADETPESLAQKIHHLEKTHFPAVIEEYAMQLNA